MRSKFIIIVVTLVFAAVVVIFGFSAIWRNEPLSKEVPALSSLTPIAFGGVTLGYDGEPMIFGAGINSPRIFALTPANTTASGSHIAALTVGTSTFTESGVTSTIPNTRLGIDTRIASLFGLVIRGVTGQTANLFEARGGSGLAIAYLDIDGNLSTSGSLRIGGASSTSGLYPTANNSYDIGGPTLSWRDFYASGTLVVGGTGTSTFRGGINLLGGAIARGGQRLTVTSTFNFVFPDAVTGTNKGSLDFIRVPTDCTIGSVTLFTTSTVATTFRSIVDVNYFTGNPGVGTTTLFTTQGERPDLGANQFSSTTVPDVTALSRGWYLNVDLDQSDNHKAMQVQIDCAREF